MPITLCVILLPLMIGSTKAAPRRQAAGPEHAVME
jgi:DHA2 family multidrug resistance protein